MALDLLSEAKVHVNFAHEERPSSPSAAFFSPANNDLLPFVIDLQSSRTGAQWRVFRSFVHLQELHDKIKEHLGDELGALFPQKKRFFGLFGKFSESETGEQRRSDLAKYLNGVLKVFKDKAPIQQLVSDSLTPSRLLDAVSAGDVDLCKQLLESGQQSAFDTEPLERNTALHLAIRAHNNGVEFAADCVSILLSSGADLHKTNKDGRTPLVEFLLADPQNSTESSSSDSESSSSSSNAKPSASYSVEVQLVKALIDSGADLSLTTLEKKTLLHRCYRDPSLIATIIDKAPRLLNYQGPKAETVLDYALRSHVPEIVSFLEALGAKRSKELAKEIEEFQADTARLGNFIQIALGESQYAETVDLLVQLGDVHVKHREVSSEDNPWAVAFKHYYTALWIANEHKVASDEAIWAQIFNTQKDLIRSFKFEDAEASQNQSKRIDQCKKQAQQLREIRSAQNKAKTAEQQLQFYTTSFQTLFHNLVKDTIAAIKPALTVPFSVLSLGPLSHGEFTPKSSIEYAILVDKVDFQTLEFFRCFTKLLELKFINLLETEFLILEDNTKSVFPRGFCLEKSGKMIACLNATGSISPLSQFIGTPAQLAAFQEQEMSSKDSVQSFALWESQRLLGDKKLFEEFRRETNRILDRKLDTRTFTIRQERCLGILKSLVQDFVPKFNRDLTAEKHFEMMRQLHYFPHQVAKLLSLVYAIPDGPNGSVWQRIDGLVASSKLSREGGENLKKALRQVVDLFLRASEQRVVSIRAVAFNNDKLSREGSEDSDSQSTEDNDQSSSSSSSSSPSSVSESGKIPLQSSSASIALSADKKMYELTAEDAENLVKVYQVIIPLMQELRGWTTTFDQGKEGTLSKSKLFADDNLTIAEGYLRMCLFQKAKEFYLAAIEKEPTNTMFINAFGKMWNKLGNFRKAIEMFEKAAEIMKEKNGETCPELSSQYSNLAMANVQLNDQLQAISWLEKALHVDETTYGMSHPYVAQDYLNLGKMWKKQGDPVKATDYYQKALEVQIKLSGEKSLEVSGIYNDIAQLAFDQGIYDMALEKFRQALAIDRQLYSGSNLKISTKLKSIADTLKQLQGFDEAQQLFEEALTIEQQVYGQVHPVVGTTLYSIASLCYSAAQYQKAMDFALRSLEVFVNTEGDEEDKETVLAFIEKCQREMRKNMNRDEYEEWKRRMAELRALKNLPPEVEEEESEEEVEQEPEEVEEEGEKIPILRETNVIGSSKINVFEDNFFEL